MVFYDRKLFDLEIVPFKWVVMFGALFLAQSLKVILVESFAFGKLYTDGGYAVTVLVNYCLLVSGKCSSTSPIVFIYVDPSLMFFRDVDEVPRIIAVSVLLAVRAEDAGVLG